LDGSTISNLIGIWHTSQITCWKVVICQSIDKYIHGSDQVAEFWNGVMQDDTVEEM